MIAYHYPPVLGSSGVQRAWRFAEYLPEFGWEPLVLAPHVRAYPQTQACDAEASLPSARLWRAFALDARRHLALRGRYPRMLALPDRWSSWWLGAVPLGLHLIRSLKPSVIWSTYPIATAHLIALALHRLTGLPWVADMRDPMVQDGFPAERIVHRAYQWIERRTLSQCDAAVVVTPGMARLFAARHPDAADKLEVIENGYDELTFRAVEQARSPEVPDGRRFVLLHSGLIYPSSRDPTHLFQALARLAADGTLDRVGFHLVLRASGSESHIAALAERTAVSRWVSIAPAIAYRDALREMMDSDGLLLLQGRGNNDVIPAKVYEYLRARRPILALTDAAGDTAALLQSVGVHTIAPMDDAGAIAGALARFIARTAEGTAPIAAPMAVARYSRAGMTGRLSALLGRVAGPGS